MEPKNYFVRIGTLPKDKSINSDGRVVEAWSVERLPLTPTGWKLKWRDKLKNELQKMLRERPHGYLAARYDSPVCNSRCDAENILFYNLRSGFKTSTRDGLRFERFFSSQPCPKQLTGPADHYHRYWAAEPGEPFDGWTQTELLAKFKDVELRSAQLQQQPGPRLVSAPESKGQAARLPSGPIAVRHPAPGLRTSERQCSREPCQVPLRRRRRKFPGA
jgi:hypothetical protein